MTTTSLRFGNLLRHLRRERALSQLQLAAQAGSSSRHLSFLETGRARPSPAMVARLASALELDPIASDDLRMAAGFCARNGARPRGIGDMIFESSLIMESAATPSQIVDAGRGILPELGIGQFFFGSLHDDANPRFEWATFGAFPTSWLQNYDRERYAITDPLLTVVRARRESFFWDDVIDQRTLTRPAREMFDSVAARGIFSGFVASQRHNGLIQIVSMMGPKMDSRSQVARLGLEIIGSRMLAGLNRLGALVPSDAGLQLPRG
jgi:transcriptional regulator with XRE-family HTH domain